MRAGVQCQKCKNYIGLMTCMAFPKGIPNQILVDEVIHDKPYPGDRGIRFEPMPEKK